MSYILDALRRLEQDKEKTKRGANPMEAVLIPDMEQVEEPERRHFWWIGVGAVLLLLAIATTYWITRQTFTPPVQEAQEGTARHLSSALPADDSPRQVTSPGSESSSYRPPVSARPAPVPSQGRMTASRPEAMPAPSPRNRPAERVDPPAAIREDRGVQAEAYPDPPVTPVRQERVALSQQASEDEVFQEWRGPEIKINAIAYSRDEAGRFAVVNLKTVREGDRVDGLAVVEIRENSIVFEEGGARYKISLGKR